MTAVHTLVTKFLNLLYPAACPACGCATGRVEFCARCRGAITTPTSPLCPTCGDPFRTAGDTNHPCGRCLSRPPRFRRARACAVYHAGETAGALAPVLQRYKYNRDISLAHPLGALMAERCPLPLAEYDVIMPVPLHVARLRWRGFNQAQFLCQAIARPRALPIDALSVERVRATRPQVQLNEADRRRNVAGAFRVSRPDKVRGRRVLLVDDVLTTGATVDECSRSLLRAGAQSVDALVLARAVLR
jgi:ComF family protein